MFCLRKLEFPRFPSLWLWPLHWNWRTWKTRKFSLALNVQWIRFIWGSCKFAIFLSFGFIPHTEIKNTENSEIFSYLQGQANLLITLYTALLEKVAHFRGFRVFDFSPCTEIENELGIFFFKNFNYFVEGRLKFSRFLSFSF